MAASPAWWLIRLLPRTGIDPATYLATPNPNFSETQANVRSVVTTTGSESGLLGTGIPTTKGPRSRCFAEEPATLRLPGRLKWVCSF
jgi:hypothetical protein